MLMVRMAVFLVSEVLLVVDGLADVLADAVGVFGVWVVASVIATFFVVAVGCLFFPPSLLMWAVRVGHLLSQAACPPWQCGQTSLSDLQSSVV